MAKNGVEGVYDKDPRTHEDATMYTKLTQEQVIERKT
jgi:uridylate kinase